MARVGRGHCDGEVCRTEFRGKKTQSPGIRLRNRHQWNIDGYVRQRRDRQLRAELCRLIFPTFLIVEVIFFLRKVLPTDGVGFLSFLFNSGSPNEVLKISFPPKKPRDLDIIHSCISRIDSFLVFSARQMPVGTHRYSGTQERSCRK